MRIYPYSVGESKVPAKHAALSDLGEVGHVSRLPVLHHPA